MSERMTGGLARGFRAAMALLLAVALSLPAGALNVQAYADEPMQPAAAAGAKTQALGGDESEIKIAVLSDMHYYPVNFVSDCEDYKTYVGGDPKMLEESGSIADAALQMVREDNPDILLVSGDLTKDGEIQGHRDLAAKFQELEDDTDTEVFVINGNHDLYNYTDACTFENGKKESAETTEQDDFKTIYKNFGYNGEYNAQYFENPKAAQGELAGQTSYTVDLGKFRIVAIDSCCYSPDGGNGMGTNEHITAGRIDEDLMPWVVDQIKDAEEAGDTVIGLMHHGVVPHFQGEEDLLYEYVVDDWQNVATQLADAGMRYVFTGHMHANDISQYTSVSGNTITDLETGSLSSWMSPQRHVTITKGEPLGDGTNRTKESFSVTSHSVKSIDFTDHNGQTQHIEDFRAYTQQKLYPETLFNNMANGMLRPILQEIGDAGIRPWLAENLPDVDIDTMVLDVARDALAGGMEIELGTGVGRVSVSYRNNGIQLQPSGTAGWALDDMTITDNQVLRLVDDVLNTVETQYIENPDWLLGEIDKIVTKVSNMGITSLTDEEHSIYDLVLVVLTGHYAGCENPPEWVENALAYIESGEIVQNLINTLKTDLMPIINTLLADNSIDTGIAFSGLWKTAIDTATDDGNLKETLDLFGFDEAAISELIDGLINEYLTPSFLTGMGSLISDVAGSMLYDMNFTDDVIDSGNAVVIEFDGSKNAPEASVENGLLPTQVTMTLGADSENSRNFRWYTGLNIDSGTVQVATDSGFSSIVAEKDASREEVVKPKTRMNLGLITTYGTQEAAKYSASVTGLDDGATYYYRVGDKDANLWSAAYQFTAGDATDGDDAFTFINVNDSQGMVESDYDVYLNTLAQADATFPTASFTVHGGDFVDDGANEDYWTWALDDANGVAQGMAMTPAAGNHEAKSEVEGITDANPIVSHFNLANVPEGQDLSTGVYYSYVYKNATFVVLNTNDLSGNELSQAQYSWAYDTLANADTEWKIVLMHKSPYSNGPHQADDDVLAIRSQINSLAAATDVDVVLSGHDHVYNRTPYLAHGNEQNVTTETQSYEGVNYETALNPSGTVFVIAGTCGVKNYVQTPSDSIPSEVSLDLSVPVFTGITIDGDHLYYRAYKVEGGSSVLVDSFAISKAEEDAAPAWKQVEDMIAALPEQSEVTMDDKKAIEAARAAYDELSAEDQQKVSNYDRLVAAERMLSLLQNVDGKRTVTVTNHDDFTNAINDPSVGTIITQGTIEFDEGGLFDDGDREIYVRRDVVVGGTGELHFCRFHVQNGATLVLKDSVYVNDTRSQGSFYDALNPVEVYANSTLITQGSVSLRTEYGTGGSDQGMAVKLVDNGASAILGGAGSYWGAEAAVYSTVADSTVVIDGGSYNLKNNNHSAIDSPGSVTVNGGSISSLWCGGTLRVNGGTFEHEDSASNTRKPVQFDGSNAYVTGGTFVPYQSVAWQLSGGSTVHVMASGQGAVQIGDVDPFVGAIQTQNYKNVSAPYASVNGWGSQDGIYSVAGAASASSVEDVSALSATRLSDSSQTDNSTMNATVPSGTSTVFGKYYVSGNGKSQLSGISGGTVIAYGPVRTIQNNPVESVTIDGDATRLVDLNQEGSDTLRLNGYTTPADAFDNGVSWSSDNEQTATVAPNAGQGIVTVHQAGGANITATSDSNSDASAKVEVIAVKPALEGPDELSEDDSSATYVADKGFKSELYDGRLSFKYSVDDNTIASIDEDTGELAKLAAGSVKVTATLYLDGNPTGITVDKDVVCKLKPTASVDDVNSLIDVQVSDANKAMAAQHGAQTFDKLIDNTEGENDSYTIGEVYSEDAPAEGVIESAAQLFGVSQAEKIWKVDVTIQAAPYVAGFDELLGLKAGTHEVSGDEDKTVTLVWDNGDPATEQQAGWMLEDSAASPVTFEGACTSFQVSFEYVGAPDTAAVPESVTVLKGDAFEPAEPEDIEHYGFEGWFTDQACTKAYDPQTPVSDNITLYGKWTAETYQVSFDADGGAFADGEGDPIEVAYNGVWPTLPEPTKAGFAFQGWFLDDGDEAVQVEAGDKVSITGDATLAAKWAENQAIAITPDAGNAAYVYDGEGHGFAFSKSPDDSLEGFEVEYRPAGSADDVAWTADVPVNAGTYDVRVTRAEDEAYAAFEQTFEGGVVIAKAKLATPDVRYTEGEESGSVAVLLKNGDADMYYWSESDDKSDPVEAESARFEVTEPGTYYVWGAGDDNHEDSDVVTATIVKVSFDDNDGIVGADESEGAVFTKGTAEVLLPKDQCLDSWGGLPEVEWAGHEFLGWQLPGGKELTKLTAIVESATATAQWGVDAAGLTAYVVFDADGGTFSDGSSSATVEVPLTSAADYVPIGGMPADPTRTGYDFAGWFYTDPLTQQEEAFDPERTEVAGSMNVYAKWAEKQAIAITPDEGNVKYVYDGEGHGFAFSKSPDDSLEGFEVEYRPAGSADDVAWTADVPVNAGTYDVRVTRAEDEAYAAFEQTFEGGVVIAKADQAAPALEVTPGVDEATIKIEGAEDAHVAAAYEWSAAEDFSNAQTIEGDSFEATASGTYYVRAVADANHNAGAPANVTLAMVTFDAAGGTLSGNATWLLETGTSVGDANLPTATWNEHGFEGWALADGTAFDGSSVVNGDLEVAAQWSVGAETLAPAAPTGAYVAERLQGVSVALHGVNEINSANDGGAHPDVTFAASGDNVQPLIADSFQIGQPAETDGVWTVSVVLDAQKYLEAYAQMGDPAYGAHYFADPDEDGQESFTLAYDKTSRTWKLAEDQQAGYTFDITCLTLRPAELVKYTGGIDGGEVHFPDARVVDGQGNVYTIDQLNALLDEGTTARVAYFDGDGAELADDTVPGVYEARIVVDAATALLARVADQDAEDSVDVNVDGNVYRFSLEPSTLTIRNASDDAAAESGALDVELIAADAGSSDITAAVNAASGGVAAQLPKGTRIFVNDRESGELTGEELPAVRLFSDELLGADDSDGVDRLADLKARAAQEGYEIADEASDFQYLDLVDAGQSNLWVSSTEGATIYWKVPEGADPDSLRVLHFADLHREYGVNAADLQQQIAACAVEEMPLDTTHVADGYVSFPVERAGFSPFVLTWDAAEPDNPDQPVQMATVTFDANGGQLPAGAPASVEVTAGGTVAALPEPVRAGYTFAGWTDASGGPFTSETVVSGSMTVVAQWAANVYPVTLDPQGGAFGDPSQATIRATFGATVGQLPQPSRDGYEFVGWFTQQQGGEQVTASTVYATAASSTYYAQWKTLPAAQAAVTLDANGGAFADGTATAQVMLADGAVLHRSDLPQPSRAGYLLAGWCLDAALTQPVLFADDELAPGKQPTVATEGLVLYAKWLGDLSGEASFSFANVQQAYTGAPVPAVPTFGSGFPAAEQARVKVLYHPAQAGADAWSDQAPRNVGSYDVRFVYGGSDAYAPFEKDYPAGIVIAKATLTQTGLVASPAEVKEGMKLADISLTGATVTSSETGAAVEGAWSWVDADGAVDESGMYQAVFVPTDTANYDLLYVEVPLTVQADEPDQPGSGDEPIDPDRPGSDDKPSNPDEPGSGDEPTDPDEPGTSPDQPGSGELGTGGDSDSGVGAGSDNSNGRNQVKLVATGDPIAGVLVGLGAVLIAALITGLVALRNTRRKN